MVTPMSLATAFRANRVATATNRIGTGNTGEDENGQQDQHSTNNVFHNSPLYKNELKSLIELAILEQHQAALEAYSKMCAPCNIALAFVAWVLRGQGETRACLELALKLQKRGVTMHGQIASAARGLNLIGLQKQALQQALHVRSWSCPELEALYRVEHGFFLLQHHRIDQAQYQLDLAFDLVNGNQTLEPMRARIAQYRSSIAMLQNKSRVAQQIALAALPHAGESRAEYLLANIMYSSLDLLEYEQAFEAFKTINPDSSIGQYARARFLNAIGKHTQAFELFYGVACSKADTETIFYAKLHCADIQTQQSSLSDARQILQDAAGLLSSLHLREHAHFDLQHGAYLLTIDTHKAMDKLYNALEQFINLDQVRETALVRFTLAELHLKNLQMPQAQTQLLEILQLLDTNHFQGVAAHLEHCPKTLKFLEFHPKGQAFAVLLHHYYCFLDASSEISTALWRDIECPALILGLKNDLNAKLYTQALRAYVSLTRKPRYSHSLGSIAASGVGNVRYARELYELAVLKHDPLAYKAQAALSVAEKAQGFRRGDATPEAHKAHYALYWHETEFGVSITVNHHELTSHVTISREVNSAANYVYCGAVLHWRNQVFTIDVLEILTQGTLELKFKGFTASDVADVFAILNRNGDT
jgi:hypothetical protein